jgi:hypothetical protein
VPKVVDADVRPPSLRRLSTLPFTKTRLTVANRASPSEIVGFFGGSGESLFPYVAFLVRLGLHLAQHQSAIVRTGTENSLQTPLQIIGY